MNGTRVPKTAARISALHGQSQRITPAPQMPSVGAGLLGSRMSRNTVGNASARRVPAETIGCRAPIVQPAEEFACGL